MNTTDWKFEPDYNRVTAIDQENCRITIADKIYGVDEADWIANGKMIAMAQRLAKLVRMIFDAKNLEDVILQMPEAESIVNELAQQEEL